MLGRDEDDPLFLQLKEAQPSVLEPLLGQERFNNHGQRVVEGQRLMQAASDIMLGWIRIDGFDGVSRDFYMRQLWDGKGSALVEVMNPQGDDGVRGICGGHSRGRTPAPGDAIAIASYLGGATASIARWLCLRRHTPTRTNATMTPCARRLRPVGSLPRQASDPRFRRLGRAKRHCRVTSRRGVAALSRKGTQVRISCDLNDEPRAASRFNRAGS